MEEALKRIRARVITSGALTYVMYMDLDHFKAVNDVCGHAGGDELLRQMAAKFKAVLRDSDFLARIGGDEFAAVIFVRGQASVEQAAQKLIATIGDLQFRFGGESYRVGLSVGVALLDVRLESTGTALVHADAALYEARERGRGRYHLHTDEVDAAEPASEFVSTAEMLRSGLDENRFSLYFQKIVDGEGRRLDYESLLRLNSAGGEVIGPDVLLPMARRLGMMSRIDRRVVTCRWSPREWRHARA